MAGLIALPAHACTGDCDGDGRVAVFEIIRGVRIALGDIELSTCVPFDEDGDGAVTANEIVRAIAAALNGCPATPTPTATVTPTATPTPTPAQFVDVTLEAGIDYIQYDYGQRPPPIQVVYLTGGAAAGDFDNDGWTDLFVTRMHAPPILYRNQRDGTFADVTDGSGLDLLARDSNGAGWADIDGDGDLDLYVTVVSETADRFYLFINDGTGRFTEEAIERGAAIFGAPPHFGSGIAFGDYDRDGWLDIHVSDWRYDFENPANAPANTRLLRNRGVEAPGYFEDVTAEAGVVMDGVVPKEPRASGTFAFGATFSDLDDDGWLDLAIAADYGTSRLFWNNGDGTFTDGTDAAGVGLELNGMGSAIGDYDGDGRLDWFVTSIYDPVDFCAQVENSCFWDFEGNRLYRNEGGRRFSDHTDIAGVRDNGWGWGTQFFDYDNDGDLDLVATNGMRFPFLPEEALEIVPFQRDPKRLWRNDGTGVMTEVSALEGLTDTGLGKGLLVFDYDNDGDLDVFMTNNAGTPVLYRNRGNDNGWLRVQLRGSASNRLGIGARVTVQTTPSAPTQVREIYAGSSYIAQSEAVAHFGLGPGDESAHEVRVTWPRSGMVQVLRDVPRNQLLTVVKTPQE